MAVKVKMNPASQIIREKGIGPNGQVQLFHTMNIMRRMGRYMPHLTGTMETKLTHVASPTSIETLGPYAMYQYHGKVMVDPETGIAGFKTADGWKSRRGSKKVLTDRDLTYTKTFNPLAGPYWDIRLLAAERDQIAAETTAYLRRRK